MTTPEFDAEAYIVAVAPTLGLDIQGARRAQVAVFLGIAKGMADLLDAAPVPDGTLDLAPVFSPSSSPDGEAGT